MSSPAQNSLISDRVGFTRMLRFSLRVNVFTSIGQSPISMTSLV